MMMLDAKQVDAYFLELMRENVNVVRACPEAKELDKEQTIYVIWIPHRYLDSTAVFLDFLTMKRYFSFLIDGEGPRLRYSCDLVDLHAKDAWGDLGGTLSKLLTADGKSLSRSAHLGKHGGLDGPMRYLEEDREFVLFRQSPDGQLTYVGPYSAKGLNTYPPPVAPLPPRH